MKDPRQKDVRESTVVLVCRDITLEGDDRRELERSEAALAHIFLKIHRIEWTVTGRSRPKRSVEVHARMHARGGDFEGHALEADARTAFQAVTKKLLAQKRARKAAKLGSRRSALVRLVKRSWN